MGSNAEPQGPDFPTIIKNRTDPETGDILGVVLTVFDKTGREFFTIGSGRKSWKTSEPIKTDDAFFVFSVTKPLTTIAALQAVERGLITLDEPVENILTELKESQIITKSEDGTLSLAPAKNKITLRHLLTHTSGVGYDGSHPTLLAWRESRNEQPLTFSGRVREAYSVPLLFEPGESWVYGGGLDWAGQLVERLNGNISLEEYFQKNIFDPLGLTSSTFHPGKRTDILERIVDMSFRGNDGKLIPGTVPIPLDPETDSGGMGLVSTVPDIRAILADILSEEPKLLKRSTVDEMFKPQFDTHGPQAQGLLAMNFMYKNLTGGVDVLGKVSWGLGGLILLEDTPNLPKGSLTWGGMPNLGWFLNRDRGIGGIYASQTLPPPDPNSASFMGQFLQEIWKRVYASFRID